MKNITGCNGAAQMRKIPKFRKEKRRTKSKNLGIGLAFGILLARGPSYDLLGGIGMQHFLSIGLVGYLTAFSGFFLAGVFCFAVGKLGNRFLGTMMGFTAGIIIAFICFELIPGSLERFGLYKGIIAMLLGVALSAWLEGRLGEFHRYEKAGLLLVLGVTIHNIPEGMALGSLLHVSFPAGVSLAIMIAAHCFPEGLAVMLPFKQAGAKASKMLALSLLVPIPMSVGALSGALISSSSPLFVDACLCFSGGVMLYIACGNILPESKDVWRGRMSAIGAMLGFVAGVWLTAKL
jgi:ZIP family zinc transporter